MHIGMLPRQKFAKIAMNTDDVKNDLMHAMQNGIVVHSLTNRMCHFLNYVINVCIDDLFEWQSQSRLNNWSTLLLL